MKLCIPICAPNGLESTIEPHLPNAEHLLIFDTEKRDFTHISLLEQAEGAGQEIRIDVVICGSFDTSTKRALEQRGIQAFGTEAETAGEAIRQLERGELHVEQQQASSSNSGGCGGGCGGHEDKAKKSGCGSHGKESHGGGCGCGDKQSSHGHDENEGCCGKHDEEDHECCGQHDHGKKEKSQGCGSHGGGCGSHKNHSHEEHDECCGKHEEEGHECCGKHDHGHEETSHGCSSHGAQGHACGCGSAEESEAIAPVSIDLSGEAHIVAVCSQNKKTITDHAGRCRNFWIYDIAHGKVVGKTLLSLPIEQSFHETKGDQEHPLDNADILVTGGLSANLQKRLLKRGIQAIVTTETDPDQVVEDLLEIAG